MVGHAVSGRRTMRGGARLPAPGVTLRVMAIVLAVEMAIMFVGEFAMPREYRHLWAFIDPFLLAVLAAPLVAWWVIRPYEAAHVRALADSNRVATRDPLTGLANRRLFMQFIDHAVAGAKRHHRFGAIVVLDLDRFHQINETFGYEAGDTVLAGVAQHIAGALRAEDYLCRVGGDEFAVALVDLGDDRFAAERLGREIADKIRFAVRGPIPFDRQLLQVDASVGLTLYGGDGLSAEMALREAGAAVARAKSAGRGQVVVAGGGALETREAMLAEVERDHLQIEALVDELILAPSNRLAALQQLADQVLAHFRYEDDVIARVQGLAGKAHQEAHAELAQRIEAVVAAASEETAPRIGTDMHAWIQAHISEFDKRLVGAPVVR